MTHATGSPVEPVEQFLRHRFDSEASPNTLKGYFPRRRCFCLKGVTAE